MGSSTSISDGQSKSSSLILCDEPIDIQKGADFTVDLNYSRLNTANTVSFSGDDINKMQSG